MRRREFLAWLCKIGGGATVLTLGPGLLPLRRVNTVLFGGTAHAQEPCTQDVCTTRDICESGDAGHVCQVKDVCDVDESGDCTNDSCSVDESGPCQGDQCGADKSGECENDFCVSDESGSCISDACRGDKSAACVSDRCGSDKSGECAGDICPTDKSGVCISDRCTADKSGQCAGYICTGDKSGECQSDRCRGDSSQSCKGDVCETDKSGYCQKDDCDADKSGECLADACASDISGGCAGDTCTVSDASGACISDTCSEDKSTQCVSDTCTIDTRLCESDATCPVDQTCVMDGFCPLDGACILDGVFPEGGSATGKGGLANAALKWLYRLVALLLFLPFLTLPRGAEAAVYNIAAGDVPGLIAAMEAANASPDADTINLAAGDYVLTVPYYPLGEEEDYWVAGLPSVTSPITINGSAAATTTVRRLATAEEDFSVFHVTKTEVEVSEGNWEERVGNLSLNRLVIRGGRSAMGGGIFNQEATLTVACCTIRDNAATDEWGDDAGGGGIANFLGGLTIANSTISGNTATAESYEPAGGGGIENIGGQVTLRNSTLYGNTVQSEDSVAAGGGMSGSAFEILNVTVAGNQAVSTGQEEPLALAGGLFFPGGLKNSIVAQNTADEGPDVFNTASQGYNIIKTSTADSFFVSGTSDLINTDPDLGAYTDSGAPGKGYLPILDGSPAIDSAHPASCTPQDQLGRDRRDTCDRGAVEYAPVICPQCSGDPVNLQGDAFPANTDCECRANTSITIGSGVIVRSGSRVTFKAPKVIVKSGSRFESGSVVKILQ